MKKLPLFRLEDYLSTREFNASYMLCGSDMESYSMKEILDLSDRESKKLWEELSLKYTEPFGMTLLLEEIAKLYGPAIDAKHILSFSGAEEGIYAAFHALLGKDDHVIVITPCYQSLTSVPSSLCEVTEIALEYKEDWKLDLQKIAAAIKPNTKLLVLNFPHNPTGALISAKEQLDLVELARKNQIWIFSDEVYHFLEVEEEDRIPLIATIYEKGISLGVMSKSFGLPGIRIGWIAVQDREILQTLSNIKHYLSICNSAPSEILALIALRNKKQIFSRNRSIIGKNLACLEYFFEYYRKWFSWVKPKGGCIAFPKLKISLPVYDFAESLRKEKSVILLPDTVYEHEGNHFRIGFGRKNMPEALGKFGDFIDHHQREWAVLS